MCKNIVLMVVVAGTVLNLQNASASRRLGKRSSEEIVTFDPSVNPSPTPTPTTATTTTTTTPSPEIVTNSPTVGPPGPVTSSPGGGGTSNITNPGVNGTVQQLPSGSMVTMNPGNVYQISSPNFGNGNYGTSETSDWVFDSNGCTLSAICPCVDIPPSWNCAEGYLKIRSGILYDLQKFCGGNKPGQPFVSDTGELHLRFRSGFRRTGTGFTCFVSCTGVGLTPPTLPSVGCPAR